MECGSACAPDLRADEIVWSARAGFHLLRIANVLRVRYDDVVAAAGAAP